MRTYCARFEIAFQIFCWTLKVLDGYFSFDDGAKGVEGKKRCRVILSLSPKLGRSLMGS